MSDSNPTHLRCHGCGAPIRYVTNWLTVHPPVVCLQRQIDALRRGPRIAARGGVCQVGARIVENTMAAHKPDSLVYAVTQLVRRVLDWGPAAREQRCSTCGAQVHITPAAQLLFEAIARYHAVKAERAARERFESEAPTTKRGKL
jgi:hypothetical protein